jgi:hypothetical protein
MQDRDSWFFYNVPVVVSATTERGIRLQGLCGVTLTPRDPIFYVNQVKSGFFIAQYYKLLIQLHHVHDFKAYLGEQNVRLILIIQLQKRERKISTDSISCSNSRAQVESCQETNQADSFRSEMVPKESFEKFLRYLKSAIFEPSTRR